MGYRVSKSELLKKMIAHRTHLRQGRRCSLGSYGWKKVESKRICTQGYGIIFHNIFFRPDIIKVTAVLLPSLSITVHRVWQEVWRCDCLHGGGALSITIWNVTEYTILSRPLNLFGLKFPYLVTGNYWHRVDTLSLWSFHRWLIHMWKSS